MKPRALALSLLAALAAVPVAPAQIKAQGEGYSFRVKYVPGAVAEFKGTTKIAVTGGPEGMPAPGDIEVRLKQEVVSVEDGIATLKMETKVLSAGPDGETPEPTTQTIRVNESGQTVGEDGKPTVADGTGIVSSLPAGPLKVGGKWITEADAPNGKGKIKVESTFVEMKKVEDASMARVEFKMTSDGEMPMDGEGTVLIDAADGQLVLMTMTTNMTLAIPGADTMKMSVRTTIERVAEGA